MRDVTIEEARARLLLLVGDKPSPWGFARPSYAELFTALGEVLLVVDDGGYQGDIRVMLRGVDNCYGYLIQGFGSCSGCDALEACENFDDVAELYRGMMRGVAWFDSLAALQEYFRTKDWEVDYAWHADETKEFVAKVLAYRETIGD